MALPVDVLDDVVLSLALMDDPDLYRRWRYYSGDHPRVYLSTKLMEIFRGLTDSMNDNYCGLAVNARVSRLQIEGWDAPEAQDVWEASRLPQRQDRLFRWALAYGIVVVVAEEEEGGSVLRPNRPTQACAVESDENPEEYRLAAKRWTDRDGHHLTLWYPDEVVRLVHPRGQQIEAVKYDFDPDDPGGVHDYDRVPAVAVRPFADGPVLLDTLQSPQDRINKITSNKMVAGEFSAFAQRVYFTRQDVDPYNLRQAPDHAIVLDPGDPGSQTSVQQLPGSSLDPYIHDRNDEIDNLFTLASLPRHMRVNPGTPPSGATVKADEGPFVEVLHDHQREIGEALVSALRVLGIDSEPAWRAVEVDDDPTATTAFATVVSAGIPWQIAAREYLNWDDETIEEAEALRLTGRGVEEQAAAAMLNQFMVNPELPPPTEQVSAAEANAQVSA